MADIFQRKDFDVAESAAMQSATELLDWAQAIADNAQPEQIFRHKEGRTTLRISLPSGGYFLKFHRGVGYREIAKNIIRGKLPVFGARDEFHAVEALHKVGVATLSVAAFASEGKNPATRRSLVITDELRATVSLEDFCRSWPHEPPAVKMRVALLREVASIAQSMHHAGINHRDFYLCHLHLRQDSIAQNTPSCYLIDLHRAQAREQIPRRMQVKDLAGLYYSAMDIGLTARDLLRFIHYYTPGGLRAGLRSNAILWQQVVRRAHKLYAKHNGPIAAYSVKESCKRG